MIELDYAIKVYTNIKGIDISSQSENEKATLNIAVDYHKSGRINEAINIYAELFNKSPNNSNIAHLLGLALHQKGNNTKSIELISRAVNLSPKTAVYRCNFGKVLNHIGNLLDAEKQLKTAIELDPNLLESYNLLGINLSSQNKLIEAKEILEQLINKAPTHINGINSLGNVYYLQSDINNAELLFEKANSISPDNPITLNNLAKICVEKSQYKKAIDLFKRSSELSPNTPLIYNNLCHTYTQIRDTSSAIQYADKAISLYPQYAEAHWNKAIALLLSQDYINGWREFEWRLNCTRFNRISIQDQKTKKWNCEPLAGKTLLILDEQGHGDTLQFCRYIQMINKDSGRIILSLKKPLIDLIKKDNCIDEVIETSDTIKSEQFDYYIPLMSLPFIFKTDISSIPNQHPYLQSDISDHKFDQLISSNNFNVGIVWAGNSNQKNDQNRSTSANNFLELINSVSGKIKFYSLQKGPDESNIEIFKSKITDLSNHINDYNDTANAISKLDLVISVCTSVAHLSGALNKPTWVLLCHNADWRWHLDGSKTPWYPSMKLFRQRSLGNWQEVFNNIKQDLKTLITKTNS